MVTNEGAKTSCERLLWGVAEELLKLAQDFINEFQSRLKVLTLLGPRSKSIQPLPFDDKNGIFLAWTREHGYILAIEQWSLVNKLTRYRILIEDTGKQTILGTVRSSKYTEYKPVHIVGFTLASEKWCRGMGLLHLGSGSNIITLDCSTSAIRWVAEELATAIPGADQIFSAITYLWDHVDILDTFIAENENIITEGENQGLHELDDDSVNDGYSNILTEDGIDLYCQRCGIMCEILSYSWYKIDEGSRRRVCQCIKCQVPEDSTNSTTHGCISV